MEHDSDNEYMTATEARERLDITKSVLARWLKEGVLPYVESPYNKRLKLVRREDVERLAAEPRVTRKDAPAA